MVKVFTLENILSDTADITDYSNSPVFTVSGTVENWHHRKNKDTIICAPLDINPKMLSW